MPPNHPMVNLNKHNKENATQSPLARKEDEEEQKGGEDDHRQGVKTKPKINTGKLPSAFTNPQIKYKSNKNESKIKHIKEAIQRDDSRKHKQNPLDPLLISKGQKDQMKRHLDDGIKQAGASSKYDQMAKSQSNGFGSFKNIGGDIQINAISPTDIKLQQMVSLALIKSSSVSGPIKKMLHVPTFAIYCVKEIPISSRDARTQLKKWIIEWESALVKTEGQQHLVAIHGTHWNSPEG